GGGQAGAGPRRGRRGPAAGAGAGGRGPDPGGPRRRAGRVRPPPPRPARRRRGGAGAARRGALRGGPLPRPGAGQGGRRPGTGVTMPGRLAVDFGTSNTVVAVWDEARGEGVPLFVPDYGVRLFPQGEGGESIALVPSLIHYAAGSRRWLGQQVHQH